MFPRAPALVPPVVYLDRDQLINLGIALTEDSTQTVNNNVLKIVMNDVLQHNNRSGGPINKIYISQIIKIIARQATGQYVELEPIENRDIIHEINEIYLNIGFRIIQSINNTLIMNPAIDIPVPPVPPLLPFSDYVPNFDKINNKFLLALFNLSKNHIEIRIRLVQYLTDMNTRNSGHVITRLDNIEQNAIPPGYIKVKDPHESINDRLRKGKELIDRYVVHNPADDITIQTRLDRVKTDKKNMLTITNVPDSRSYDFNLINVWDKNQRHDHINSPHINDITTLNQETKDQLISSPLGYRGIIETKIYYPSHHDRPPVPRDIGRVPAGRALKLEIDELGYIKNTTNKYGLFVIHRGTSEFVHVRVGSYNAPQTNIPKGEMTIADVNNYLKYLKINSPRDITIINRDNSGYYKYYDNQFDTNSVYFDDDLFYNGTQPRTHTLLGRRQNEIGKYTAIREFEEETGVEMENRINEISGPFEINISRNPSYPILVQAFAIILEDGEYRALFNMIDEHKTTHEVNSIFYKKYLKYKKKYLDLKK
jgi:hypothetical protein